QQPLRATVEHRRYAYLARPAAALRNQLTPHRARLVAPREKLLADRVPVFVEVGRQLRHRHAVDARTALVAPHAPECLHGIRALDHPFHEPLHERRAVASRAFLPVRRPSGFPPPLYSPAFTRRLER